MMNATAVMGKAGSGKTFVAAHIAMALSYLGINTLLIGGDQKQDLSRALLKNKKPSLMEGLETHRFDYQQTEPEQVLNKVSDYVDLLELGPSPLLSGSYGGVLDEAFHWLEAHQLAANYTHILFDIGDDRFDSALLPLFRRVRWIIGVTEETPESLFVVNRMIRAVLIGSYEYHYPGRLLGLVCNRSQNPLAFQRYVEGTKAFPLMRIPKLDELAALRPFHTHLFAMQKPPRHLDQLVGDFIKIGDLLRGNPLNLYPCVPLEDQALWKLPPPVANPS